MASEASAILDFLRLSERLKTELRHSWLSSGRRESVAEHTWQMALMALVAHRHLEHPVAIDRVLRMILVHDLVEAEVGDVPFFETGARKDGKAAREQAAIGRIRDMLAPETGAEIHDSFQEYEAAETLEARFAKALDNLEVQLQHNLADLSSWEEVEYELVYSKMDRFCRHDRFLRELCEAIKTQAEDKMRAAGVDVAAVKQRVEAQRRRAAEGTARREETLEQRIERVVREEVALAPYDPSWPEAFRREKAHLLACLPQDLVRRVEHFGSTAVPGLAAKPIIDLLVEVTDLEATRLRIAPLLEAQGYDYFWRPTHGDDGPPFYAWFIKRAPETGTRTHHIHMIERSAAFAGHWDALLFRDHLIEHPEVAREYEALKLRLAREHPRDRVAYTAGKTAFVLGVTEDARRSRAHA